MNSFAPPPRRFRRRRRRLYYNFGAGSSTGLKPRRHGFHKTSGTNSDASDVDLEETEELYYAGRASRPTFEGMAVATPKLAQKLAASVCRAV
jgi:hypothetical protein